jgi:RNA polymerase sigma factor for flagellar operon FliA
VPDLETSKADAAEVVAALWADYGADPTNDARERLILHYSPLVKFVAGRVAAGLPQSIEQSDLVSYGIFGLIDAIDKFDPERGFKFETYAISRIKGAIIDELRSLDWVPRSVRAKAREVEKAHSTLENKLGRAPSEEEMAAELGVSVEDFRTTLLEIANSSVLALDDLWTASDPDGGQVSLLDTIRDPNAVDPEEAIDTVELKDRLAEAIESLPDRERLVIALYYYEALTLREIGEVLGVTESRVSQLHTKAVLGMRSHLQPAA